MEHPARQVGTPCGYLTTLLAAQGVRDGEADRQTTNQQGAENEYQP